MYIWIVFLLGLILLTVWHIFIIRHKINWIFFWIGLFVAVVLYFGYQESLPKQISGVNLIPTDSGVLFFHFINFSIDVLLVFQALYLVRDLFLYFRNVINKRNLFRYSLMVVVAMILSIVLFNIVYRIYYYPTIPHMF